MRIEDVKVGDVVTLRPWSGRHRTVGELVFDNRSRVCNTLQRVVQIDATDLTVQLDCFSSGLGLIWWPIVACESTTSAFMTALQAAANKPDPPNATQLLVQLHEREKAELHQQLESALKIADRAARQETLLDREVTSLRLQVAALEKQVADLKAERDRVGKTSQTGTRFAQLELD